MAKMQNYRYTECGLDDVIIEGLEVLVDDAGEEVYCIPSMPLLHRAISHSIITRESGLSGKEMRFLRTEMGVSQAEMAELIKVSRATINRWEQGKTDIDPNAELVIRMIAAERLDIDPQLSVEEIAKRCVRSAERPPIRIDGTDPSEYRRIAA